MAEQTVIISWMTIWQQACEKPVKESEAEAEMEKIMALPDVKPETVRIRKQEGAETK